MTNLNELVPGMNRSPDLGIPFVRGSGGRVACPKLAINAGHQGAGTKGRAPRDFPMNAAVRAGALYFACVFAAGLALGAIRVLAIAPAIRLSAADYLRSFAVVSLTGRMLRCIMLAALGPIR